MYLPPTEIWQLSNKTNLMVHLCFSTTNKLSVKNDVFLLSVSSIQQLYFGGLKLICSKPVSATNNFLANTNWLFIGDMFCNFYFHTHFVWLHTGVTGSRFSQRTSLSDEWRIGDVTTGTTSIVVSWERVSTKGRRISSTEWRRFKLGMLHKNCS